MEKTNITTSNKLDKLVHRCYSNTQLRSVLT